MSEFAIKNIDQVDEELGQFQEPKEIWKKMQPETLGVSNDEFFNNPKYQLYREGWAASLFARGFSSLVRQCKIRLCVDENFPDFEIRVEGHIHPFELTEVPVPGRKRGDEYSEEKGPPGRFADSEEAAMWICNGVESKSSKHYEPKPNLLICASFNVAKEFNLDCVRELCKKHRSAFKSIWLLWAVSIAQLFSGDDFSQVCLEWSEIPGYLEECKKRMGMI